MAMLFNCHPNPQICNNYREKTKRTNAVDVFRVAFGIVQNGVVKKECVADGTNGGDSLFPVSLQLLLDSGRVREREEEERGNKVTKKRTLLVFCSSSVCV